MLLLLGATLAAAAVIFGVGAYLDRLSALDDQFVLLQKRALRQASATPAESDAGTESLKARFWADGPLPQALPFASVVQDVLKAAGLGIMQSRILPADAHSSWVEFQTEGGIEAWFSFLKNLRARDPKTLFHGVTLVHRSGTSYFITFEVGHVALP
jgi:hypothetical protein